MESQTTLLSSIPERSIRDSYLTALLIVCISIKWLYSIVFVFVFVVIFLSFSVIQSYRSMTMKNFFECQIAVNVLTNFPTKLGSTYSGNIGHNNDFNLLSINVRDIRTFEKRKAVLVGL